MSRVLIAVIAYNEEKNLSETLKDLKENGPRGVDIVVIDNGSSDQTPRVAQDAGVPVVSHCVNSGGSMGTVMSYFLYAHRNRYDCLCQFDGDGQHVAAELSKIIDPILSGQADYVIGSRFLQREGFQSYFFRRIGIRLFALLDSLVVGQSLSVLGMGLETIRSLLPGAVQKQTEVTFGEMNRLLKETMGSVRAVMSDLRPPLLDDLGVPAALGRLELGQLALDIPRAQPGDGREARVAGLPALPILAMAGGTGLEDHPAPFDIAGRLVGRGGHDRHGRRRSGGHDQN